MHFEINVVKSGKHFFATAERSLTTFEKAQEVYNDLRELYKGQPNVKIDVTMYQSAGTQMTGTFAKNYAATIPPEPTSPPADIPF